MPHDDAFLRVTQRLVDLQHINTRGLPSRLQAERFLDETLDLVFPQMVGNTEPCTADDMRCNLERAMGLLCELLSTLPDFDAARAEAITRCFFFDKLPGIAERLWKDAQAIYDGDPAARSLTEVVMAYPGLQAIATHRIAHEFHLAGVPILPRLCAEVAHQRTGIDIHPGAIIGDSFCIDHGTGIVIGETAEIGEHVKLYQGVTLGALSVSKELACSKRHPTIGSHVVIYANASILGGETVIGDHSIIGGNVWVIESVPPHSLVYHQGHARQRSLLVDGEK